jgi:hypothetical protein
MPLQKSSPQGPSVFDPQTVKRCQLQERRRTLQTISELSVTDGTMPNFTRSNGPRHMNMRSPSGASIGGRKTPNMYKRRSLPQYCARPECNATHSSITMSPMHVMGVQRLHAESGVHTISSSPYEASWNARRERGRVQTEQALIGAQLRSDTSTDNLQIGNQTTLPTVSSLLCARSSRPDFMPYSSQQRVFRNSLSQPSYSKRQPGLDDSTKLKMDVRNEMGSSRRTGGDSSSFHSTHKSVVRKSRSCSSTTSYTSQEVPPIHSGPVRLAQHFHAFTKQSETTAAGRVPISGYSNPHSISRMYSLPRIKLDHGVSYGNDDNNIHMSSRARPEQMIHVSSQRAQPEWHPTHSISRLERPLGSHASYVTAPDQWQQDAVRNAPQKTITLSNSHSSGLSSNQRHSRSRSSFKASSPIRTPPPAYSANSANYSIHKQNSDEVGLSPPLDINFQKQSIPSRESLMKWKSEREEMKAEFDGIERAKMKERVRRANELEQEKEKELQELGKGIDKASRVLGRGLKTEKRGCFGGLFGGFTSKVL